MVINRLEKYRTDQDGIPHAIDTMHIVEYIDTITTTIQSKYIESSTKTFQLKAHL